MAIKNKKLTYDLKVLFDSFYSEYTSNERTLSNFETFLENNHLSTAHAEEIFNYHANPEMLLKLDKQSFKIRKTHPKRDAFMKKVLVPTAIVSATIGAGIGLIAASGLIGGSTILGIIPISGTPGLTAIATSMVGALAGLIATPAVIGVKGALTKAHYKTWYKSAKTNLKELNSGIDIESLPIKTLMNRIENTNQKILRTKTGYWFTAPFRFIRRHALNIINRNRVHHVEAYTKELVNMFHSLEHNNFAGKEEAIKPIYELLNQVDDFVAKDVLTSKVHAMLTCKESGKHIHKSIIENVDIFATLKTYIDSMSQTHIEDVKATTNQFKKNSKNIANKQAKAAEIINGERLISRLVARYESNLSTNNTSESSSGLIFEVADSNDEFIFEDLTPNDETENIVENPTEEKLPPIQQENSEELVSPEEATNSTTETLNSPAIVGSLVRKTAQRLQFSSSPITLKGQVVGAKLKVGSNGLTDTTEIRYLSSRNKIRIRTSSGDKFVVVNDSVIPPINQINSILKEVAQEKHVDHADRLSI